MDDAEGRTQARHRLHILDALVTATQRRDELVALVGATDSADDARDRLQRDWGLDAIQATALLDLQIRRLAGVERDRILAERDEIAAGLD